LGLDLSVVVDESGERAAVTCSGYGKGLELEAQLLVVALDDHDVVGTSGGEEVASMFALGVPHH
jgi:hypothetical protein